jgi:hypothetical protein
MKFGVSQLSSLNRARLIEMLGRSTWNEIRHQADFINSAWLLYHLRRVANETAFWTPKNERSVNRGHSVMFWTNACHWFDKTSIRWPSLSLLNGAAS